MTDCCTKGSMRRSIPTLSGVPRPERAMTLIEMIGVLAILAIFAAAVVPLLFRQMDRVAGDLESVTLKTFANGFQQYVLRNRYIPGASDWASVVANEAGSSISSVTTNSRNRTRYFLVDP